MCGFFTISCAHVPLLSLSIPFSMTYSEAIRILEGAQRQENFQFPPEVFHKSLPALITSITHLTFIVVIVASLPLSFCFTFLPQWGCDLNREHELFLLAHCGQLPLFITQFPASIKPFYARTLDSDSALVYTSTVAAMTSLSFFCSINHC